MYCAFLLKHDTRGHERVMPSHKMTKSLVKKKSDTLVGYGKINICITLTKIKSRLTTFRLPESPFYPTWFVIKTVYDIYQHSLHNKHHNLSTIRSACKGRLHLSSSPRYMFLYLNYQHLCVYIIYSLHFLSVLTVTRLSVLSSWPRLQECNCALVSWQKSLLSQKVATFLFYF